MTICSYSIKYIVRSCCAALPTHDQNLLLPLVRRQHCRRTIEPPDRKVPVMQLPRPLAHSFQLGGFTAQFGLFLNKLGG